MTREFSDYHSESLDYGRDAARRNNRFCRAAFLLFAGIFGLLSLSAICADGAAESPIKDKLRICRYEKQGRAAAALYFDDRIVDLERLHQEFRHSSSAAAREIADWQNSLLFLAHGKHSKLARQLLEYFRALPKERQLRLSLPAESVGLLPPVPIPAKFLLLAGNYGEHIEEGGGRAEEKAKTFPYLFWKPPTTTWKGSRAKIPLPSISPDFIDWEIELGVIIAAECRAMPATRALKTSTAS